MPTILDVARAAGVSKSTASRALSNAPQVSNDTRERVRAAALALGYRATPSAVKLATGRANAIGVLAPTLDRWYFANFLSGVCEAAAERGLDVVVYGLGEEGAERDAVITELLERVHVDGVIAVNAALDREVILRLAELGSPAVVVGPATEGVATMLLDDEAAGAALAHHLASLGHTDVAYVSGIPRAGHWLIDANAARERGARGALAEHGIRMRDAAFVPPSVGGSYAAASAIFAEAPTAIIAATDEIAIGLLTYAWRAGIRVPEDVSICGVDDHPSAVAFGLTTIRQDPRQQGADALVRVASGHADARHVSLAPALVERASTGPVTTT